MKKIKEIKNQMRKNFLKVLLAAFTFALTVLTFQASANSMNVVDFLTQERIIMTEGIELHKRTAMTAFNGNLEDKRSQNLQALIRPADSGGTKVVNWSKGTAGSWGLATVAAIARDYEEKHPGWIVLGGVNGDFYGINAPSANYGETNNTNVASGMVFRPEHGQFVLGLKDDSSYVFGKPGFNTTMTLSIYNELGGLVSEFPINKINTTPNANEIAIIFNDIADPTTINTAGAKVFGFTNQMYRRTFDNDPSPSRVHRYLATGNVSTIVDEEALTTMAKPEFKLVSKNATVNTTLQAGYKIVAQNKLTGTFADVIDATGYSHQVLVNGVPQFSGSSDAFIKGPHPRTAMGFKADGTMVLLMVDGRASTEQRNGVSLFELGELLRRFDCVQGFNFDGGGSSSLVVRNDAGQLVTVNYPSDGFDRSVANAVLIVTRDPGIKVEEIGDTYVKVTNKTPNVANNGVISNVRVTIDGETRTMIGNELIFDGLTSKMDYTLSYAYDIVEPNRTLSARGNRLSFDTGKLKPSIEGFNFLSPNAANVTLSYMINDIDGAIISKKILYADKEVILPNLSGNVTIDDFPKGEAVQYKIQITYSHDTLDEKVLTLESEVLSMTKLKAIPSIGALTMGTPVGSNVGINYAITDADQAAITKKIRINNVDYPITDNSGTFTFDALTKGNPFSFQLILEYSQYTDGSNPVVINSNTLSLTIDKTAPTITSFNLVTNDTGNYILNYQIADVDSSITGIVLTYGDQSIPLTNLSGEVAPTGLVEGVEYSFVLTVSYKATEAGNILTVTDNETLYIQPAGLPTGAIIGIAGGGGLAIAGAALFFLLKRKK